MKPTQEYFQEIVQNAVKARDYAVAGDKESFDVWYTRCRKDFELLARSKAKDKLGSESPKKLSNETLQSIKKDASIYLGLINVSTPDEGFVNYLNTYFETTHTYFPYQLNDAFNVMQQAIDSTKDKTLMKQGLKLIDIIRDQKTFENNQNLSLINATINLIQNKKPSEDEKDFFDCLKLVNEKQNSALFNCMLDIADQNISRLAPVEIRKKATQALVDNMGGEFFSITLENIFNPNIATQNLIQRLPPVREKKGLLNDEHVNAVISTIDNMLKCVKKLEAKQAEYQIHSRISPEQSISVRQMTTELINDPSKYPEFFKKSKDFRNVANGWLSAWIMKIAGLLAKVFYDTAKGNAWIKLADAKLDMIDANTQLEKATRPFNPKP